MGPSSFMLSIVDRNVVMRRIPVDTRHLKWRGQFCRGIPYVQFMNGYRDLKIGLEKLCKFGKL